MPGNRDSINWGIRHGPPTRSREVPVGKYDALRRLAVEAGARKPMTWGCSEVAGRTVRRRFRSEPQSRCFDTPV